MQPTTRHKQILRLVDSTSAVTVTELATQLSVTESTIRRDLAKLAQAGHLTRTLGGAASRSAPEQSFVQRLGEASTAKVGIARWSVTEIVNGESLLLDGGSTVTALAKELRTADLSVRVATAGLTVLEQLADVDSVALRCLGGDLRPMSQGFVGPLAESALERLTFDRAFLGTDGVDADRGVSEADLEQIRLKELMLRQSDRIYVLAHSAKLGQTRFHAWAHMPAHWTLVTDSNADAARIEPFRRRGVDVVVTDDSGRRLTDAEAGL